MRSDLYTKLVLTVIAVCLVWLSLGGPSLLPVASAKAQKPAQADTGYERVHIAGWVDDTGQIHTFSPNPASPVSVIGPVYTTR
jgi:hypothetical protein